MISWIAAPVLGKRTADRPDDFGGHGKQPDRQDHPPRRDAEPHRSAGRSHHEGAHRTDGMR